MGWRRAFWLAACGLGRAQIAAATLNQANADLQAGEADKALALLTPLPTSGAGADVAQNLLCRVRFTLEQWTQAAGECQQAVNLNQNNSDYYMWLGRVLGQVGEPCVVVFCIWRRQEIALRQCRRRCN